MFVVIKTLISLIRIKNDILRWPQQGTRCAQVQIDLDRFRTQLPEWPSLLAAWGLDAWSFRGWQNNIAAEIFWECLILNSSTTCSNTLS